MELKKRNTKKGWEDEAAMNTIRHNLTKDETVKQAVVDTVIGWC